MDWSVALLSQGIESTPLSDAEGCRLLVPTEHYLDAIAILNVYQRENPPWIWRPSIRSSTLLFHSGALGWGALILFVESWSRIAGPAVRDAGLMSGLAVQQGEWWRLFTAMTLHADLPHLMANLTTGVLLLGLAMARWNVGTALLAAWCAGAFGNLAGLLLHPDNHLGLGASGMVMGALGLLATPSRHDRQPGQPTPGLIVRGLLGTVLLFILIGVNPGSDIIAHLGGFAGGIALGVSFGLLPEHWLHRGSISLVTGAITAATLVWTWSLALAHKP
jgi:membrane associated rhomboid family serine protease